jgi:ABC-type methionine transport system ATPase subunit
MAKLRLKLVFPPQLIRQPVIHDLGEQFDVVANILRADVEIDKGWVILELEGDGEEIDLAVSWLAARGVGIEPVDASPSV